jgi:predicted transcriptional regulator
MKKSDTVVVAFRIDRALLREVDKNAASVRRSRPNYISVALESFIRDTQAEAEKAARS